MRLTSQCAPRLSARICVFELHETVVHCVTRGRHLQAICTLLPRRRTRYLVLCVALELISSILYLYLISIFGSLHLATFPLRLGFFFLLLSRLLCTMDAVLMPSNVHTELPAVQPPNRYQRQQQCHVPICVEPCVTGTMDALQLLFKAIARHDPKIQATAGGLLEALAVTLAFASHLFGAKCNFLVIQSQVGGVDRKRLASQLVHKYDYIYLQVVGFDYTGVRTLAGGGADQYQGQGSYGQELGSQDVQLNSSLYYWNGPGADPAGGEGNGGPGETPPNEDDDKDVNDEALKSKPQLACLFYKSDPHEYAQCRHAKNRSVADIRQHTLRAHRKPSHCPNCKTIFRGRNDAKLAQQRSDHIRAGTCKQRDDDVPGITEEQVQQIKGNDRRRKAVDSWYGLWSIVFPGANPPESPYLGGHFPFGEEWFQEAFAAFRASGLWPGLEGAALISVCERFLQTRAEASRAMLHSISAPGPQTPARRADPALPAGFPVLDHSSNAFQPSTLQFPSQQYPFQDHLPEHFHFSGRPPPPFVHAADMPQGLSRPLIPTGFPARVQKRTAHQKHRHVTHQRLSQPRPAARGLNLGVRQDNFPQPGLPPGNMQGNLQQTYFLQDDFTAVDWLPGDFPQGHGPQENFRPSFSQLSNLTPPQPPTYPQGGYAEGGSIQEF
ncbi:hypothetical protein BKA56DRAFT_580327 [Ilyonectria sp. MPI-CAGE-AT-0026]|nr:hypothetical protein BKA56DRAFT_580327 [Ilyonectria sp. MPI-CAGE-AT-0026]